VRNVLVTCRRRACHAAKRPAELPGLLATTLKLGTEIQLASGESPGALIYAEQVVRETDPDLV
jgi:hypothetical protein